MVCHSAESLGEIFRFAVVERDSTGGGPCPRSPLVAVVDALHPSEALMFAWHPVAPGLVAVSADDADVVEPVCSAQ